MYCISIQMDFDLEEEALARNSVDTHSLSGLISIRPEMHSTQKTRKNTGVWMCVHICFCTLCKHQK